MSHSGMKPTWKDQESTSVGREWPCLSFFASCPWSEVSVSRLVLSDSLQPVDCSLPGSFVHGLSQVWILEWAAISFSPHLYSTTKKLCDFSLPLFSSVEQDSHRAVGGWVDPRRVQNPTNPTRLALCKHSEQLWAISQHNARPQHTRCSSSSPGNNKGGAFRIPVRVQLKYHTMEPPAFSSPVPLEFPWSADERWWPQLRCLLKMLALSRGRRKGAPCLPDTEPRLLPPLSLPSGSSHAVQPGRNFSWNQAGCISPSFVRLCLRFMLWQLICTSLWSPFFLFQLL